MMLYKCFQHENIVFCSLFYFNIIILNIILNINLYYFKYNYLTLFYLY